MKYLHVQFEIMDIKFEDIIQFNEKEQEYKDLIMHKDGLSNGWIKKSQSLPTERYFDKDHDKIIKEYNSFEELLIDIPELMLI